MKGLNKVQAIGHLGSEPEVKYNQTGNPIANISVGVNDTWLDKETGQKKETTEWVRVVIFGRLAEIAGQYLHKGSHVFVEGKLKTRKWQDKNGHDRYTTEVVIDNFNGELIMLGKNEQNQISPNQLAQNQPQNQPSYQNNWEDETPF